MILANKEDADLLLSHLAMPLFQVCEAISGPIHHQIPERLFLQAVLHWMLVIVLQQKHPTPLHNSMHMPLDPLVSNTSCIAADFHHAYLLQALGLLSQKQLLKQVVLWTSK